MKNVPRKLKGYFPDHIDVMTVRECGWSGMKNGALLRAASARFEIFVSMDLGIPFQQAVSTLPISIILLNAPSNRLNDLRPLAPKLLATLADVCSGQVITISCDT